MCDYDDDDKKKIYEVEVRKILTYVVKVQATNTKEAEQKAKDLIEDLGSLEAIDEHIDMTDINKYEPEPD